MKRSLLTMLVMAVMPIAKSQEFRETIGNVTTTPTSIASYTGFNNYSTLKFSGTADLRNTNTSTGYWNASGTGDVYLSKQSVYFRIDSINTSAIAMPALAFGVRKGADADNGAGLIIEYSLNGSTWTALSMSLLPTGGSTTGWYYRVVTGLPQATALSIRFRKNVTDYFYFLDDIAVKTKTKQYADITPTTYTYKTADTANNKLDIFLPPDRSGISPLVPAMILFHGGSWQGGDKSMLNDQCQYFAKRGIVTITVNYRFINLDSTGYARTREICVRDAKSAIRWVKLNAASFGIDTAKIILGGGSAGGHLATMAAVNAAGNNDPADNLSISTNAVALALFNPAFSRSDYYSLLPYNYIQAQSPPSVMLFGEDDQWKRGGDMLYQSLQAHDVTSKLWVAANAGHGFFAGATWVFPCNLTVDNFLTSLNLLSTEGYSFPVAVNASLTLQPDTSHVGAFQETMRTADSNFTAQVYRFDRRFLHNPDLVFTGDAVVNHTQPSSGYGNASGGANISLGLAKSYFQVSGINTTGIAHPVLSFGIYKSADSITGSHLSIEYATDGLTWHPLSFTALPDTSGSAGWYYRVVNGLVSSGTLSIRFLKEASSDSLFIDDIAVDDSTAYTALHIHGVKWRQHADEEFLQTTIDWWLAKPTGSTKPGVLTALATKANAVVFRVDRQDRFNSPQSTNFGKAMDDIVDAIVKARDNHVALDVYLWGRIWLERDGGPNYTTADSGAAAVKDWFTPILDKAATAGVLDQIKGIALIETNCDRMVDVKDYAKRIADKFNAVTAWKDSNNTPFFKTRTLLVPGAGFGVDFRNVNNDNGAFFSDISQKCKHFSFIYKLMKGTDETVTVADYDNVTINGVTRTWANDIEKNAATFSVTDRMTYLNYFGLSDLTNYINTYKQRYPSVCNVVFWGDKWDGISQTQPLTRQAVHKLLVKAGGDTAVNTNYFFDLAAAYSDNTSAQKFYLFDTTLTFNPIPGWSGISAGQEWESWPQVNDGTTPFSETGGTTPGSLTATQTSGRFDMKNLLLNFGGTATMQNTQPSTGYTQASGGNAFNLTPSKSYFQINMINTSSLSSAGIGFGIYKGESEGDGSELTIKYSTDGNSWTSLSFNSLPTGSGTEGWYYRVASGLPASKTLQLRFEVDSTGADSTFIDDILVDESVSLPSESFARTGSPVAGTINALTEERDNLLLKMYPNPASKQLFLTHPAIKKGTLLTLGGTDGKIIFHETLAEGTTNTTISLDRLSLAPGIYWITIKGPGIVMSKKLIKQ